MAMTMMTFVTDAPRQCGIVKLDGRGCVIEFHEKSPDPPGALASAAVYIVEPEVADYAQARRASDFSTQVVPHFVGRIHTFHNALYHRDIGTLPSLLQAQFDYPLACAAAGEGPDHWHGLLTRDAGALNRDLLETVKSLLDTADKSASAPISRS
jgi:mannose-1-phosphate guanylyltransferase